MTDARDKDSGKNRHNENFPVGSYLIRHDLRPHVHAFYAFARDADDISDHPLLEPEEKIERLNKFAAALNDEQMNDVPSAVALRKSLRETGVSPRHSLDLIKAFKRDAVQRRYRDWDDLIDYCNYSAAPVGRHVLALHGIGEAVWKTNDALCNALQIINHIQDCADDYRELDRVYLPMDIMAANGASPADLADEAAPEGLRHTLRIMLDKVEPMLAEARTFPSLIPDLRLKAEVSVIHALAERIVALLRKRDPLCDNVKLGKASILGGTAIGVLRAWL